MAKPTICTFQTVNLGDHHPRITPREQQRPLHSPFPRISVNPKRKSLVSAHMLLESEGDL